MKLKLALAMVGCALITIGCRGGQGARVLSQGGDDVARAVRSSDDALQQMPDVVAAARNNLDAFDALKPVASISDESVEAIIASRGGVRAQARPFYQNLDNAASSLEEQGQRVDDYVWEALTSSGCAAMDYYADWGQFPSIEGFAIYLGAAFAEDAFDLPDLQVAETILASLSPLQSGQTVASWVALTVAACDYI